MYQSLLSASCPVTPSRSGAPGVTAERGSVRVR